MCIVHTCVHHYVWQCSHPCGSQRLILRCFPLSLLHLFINRICSLTPSYMYKMHFNYSYLPPSQNSSSLQTCSHTHVFLFCDPLSLPRTVYVTIGLKISLGAWWLTSGYTTEGNDSSFSQNLSITNSSSGNVRVPRVPLLSIHN